MKTVILLTACLMLFSPGAPAQAAQDARLTLLIQEALAHNPELAAAKKRWEAAKLKIPQAKAWEDPRIGIEFENVPRNPFNLGRTMTDDRMLSFSQAIPLFGKLSLKGKIAFIEAQMVAAEYKNKENEIIARLKTVFYDLSMNNWETELKNQSLVFLKTMQKNAEARYSSAGLPYEDLLKINVEIARLNTDIVNLKAQRPVKETGLNVLLNRDAEAAVEEIAGLKENLSFQQDISSLYLLTLENQPELRVLSYAVERAGRLKDLAKRNLFPDLMAEMTLRGISRGVGPWDIMLAFTVPVWFWMKQKYEIKEAVTNIEEAKLAYEAVKGKVFAEVKDLWTKVRVSRNKYVLNKEEILPLLEVSLNTSLAAFQAGRGDIMMLLDTLRLVVEAKMDYYRAYIEYEMNLADLTKETGVQT